MLVWVEDELSLLLGTIGQIGTVGAERGRDTIVCHRNIRASMLPRHGPVLTA